MPTCWQGCISDLSMLKHSSEAAYMLRTIQDDVGRQGEESHSQ